MTFTIDHDGDRRAVARILRTAPAWTGMTRCGDIDGMEPDLLLHAGPPFANPGAITRPVLNSARVSAVFEGLAGDFDDAESKIRAGVIRLRPAQDVDVVTPLAAVVSASMLLHEVRDIGDPGVRAFAPLNGGNGPAPRLGLCSDEALAHLRWMYGSLAPALARALTNPLDLVDIARDAIGRGDDCHGRTPAATALLSSALAPTLPTHDPNGECAAFLANGPSFFLNLWMAACKCMLAGARGEPGSSVVVTAGANGRDTGIQLAGLPGRWFTAEAAPPRGRFDVDAPADRALGAIGDSAIVDALGFGAMCMSHAPEQLKNLGTFMPEHGLALPGRLLSAVHPGFGDLALPVALTTRACVETGLSPVVSLGILDRDGELGRLGGGIFEQPKVLFERGMAGLEGARQGPATRGFAHGREGKG